MRFAKLGALALTIVASMGNVSTRAAIVIDQSQLLGPDHMAHFSQGDLAQSFKQSFNNITGASVKLATGIGVSGDITISLWNNLPNVFGAAQLASGTALNVSPGTFASVNFGSTVSVIPETTLFLVFTSSNNNQGLAGSTINPYTRGDVYANPGYLLYNSYDYTFETFADDAFVGSVPEAASLVVWSCVTAVVIVIRRRLHP